LPVKSGIRALIAESLNSAVEAGVDRIGVKIHVLSKQAKDWGLAAAALMVPAVAIV